MKQRPVVLIQPPTDASGKAPCLDDKQVGLGLLALAAWLEAHDIEARGVHMPLAMNEGKEFGQLLDEVCAADPLVVAIGLNWVHFSLGALAVAEGVRARKADAVIVLGGQHVSLFAEEVASQFGGSIDAVMVGEAEIPLLELCRSVLEGESIDVTIPGLCLPDGRRSEPAVVQDVDDLPLYSYRSMQPAPLDAGAAALTTTRGACPRNCLYCIEPVVGRIQGRPQLEHHSARRIAEQIRYLMVDGATRFTIQDAYFMAGDEGLEQLASELTRERIKPEHLNVFAHPDSYGERGLVALASCATRASVDLGVETGSTRVARLAGRALKPRRILRCIQDAVSAGVVPYTWWMVGLPGEDESARKETESLLLRTMDLGAIPRWVSPLILLPQSPMFERADRCGVTPRFSTFEDYCSFSSTSLAEALLFPDVITHETDVSTADDILQASRDLRAFILANFNVVESFWNIRRNAPPDLMETQTRISASFF